jgi:hypothetical protein
MHNLTDVMSEILTREIANSPLLISLALFQKTVPPLVSKRLFESECF